MRPGAKVGPSTSERKLRLLAASLAATTFLATTSCASAPADAPDALLGCYRFGQDAGARSLGLPWGFELRDAPVPDWPGVEGRQAVTYLSEARTADHPFGVWREEAGDSIVLGHPGGGGFVLGLAPSEEGLEGWGRAAGDAAAPGEDPSTRPRVGVTALRVPCPAAET